jgi:uncharacterized membrane protein
MDTSKRILVKAFTWQLLGIITMTAISYPHTGSFFAAVTLAVTSSLSGFVFFMIHEKIWNRVGWGRK